MPLMIAPNDPLPPWSTFTPMIVAPGATPMVPALSFSAATIPDTWVA